MFASFLIMQTTVGVIRKLTKTNNNICAIIFMVAKIEFIRWKQRNWFKFKIKLTSVNLGKNDLCMVVWDEFITYLLKLYFT